MSWQKNRTLPYGIYSPVHLIRCLRPGSPIISLSGIDPFKKVNEITKAERTALLRLLKDLPLHLNETAGFEQAVITSGGVNLKEIDPKTMESRKHPGIFFAGEVIDADAYTGGFDLQIAFSTGRAAGEAAAKE